MKLKRPPRGTPMRGSACIAWMVRETLKAAPHPTSRKLGEDGIRQVLARLADGAKAVDLAREFGVSPSLIWHTKTHYAKTRR